MYKVDSFDDPEIVDNDCKNDELNSSKTCIKLNEKNIYQNVELQPGQLYEIIIKNDDPRAVLTWDYESVRTDVLFAIYETSESIDNVVKNGKVDLKCDKFSYYNQQFYFNLKQMTITHQYSMQLD